MDDLLDHLPLQPEDGLLHMEAALGGEFLGDYIKGSGCHVGLRQHLVELEAFPTQLCDLFYELGREPFG